MPKPVLPSPLALVVAFFADHPELAPLHGGRVGIDLSGLPAVRVSNLGGPSGWYEGQARLSAESWAKDWDTADLLARTLVSCLPDLVTPGGQVRGVGDVSGPLERQDSDDAYQHVVDFSIFFYA